MTLRIIKQSSGKLMPLPSKNAKPLPNDVPLQYFGFWDSRGRRHTTDDATLFVGTDSLIGSDDDLVTIDVDYTYGKRERHSEVLVLTVEETTELIGRLQNALTALRAPELFFM